ncbi:hypothetical protein NC652_033206 [Populus alba x Populus x berolinensis]|nr:hypothetical protein NC652_033206 [Populus alba x Populus x berolinensis]
MEETKKKYGGSFSGIHTFICFQNIARGIAIGQRYLLYSITRDLTYPNFPTKKNHSMNKRSNLTETIISETWLRKAIQKPEIGKNSKRCTS